MNLNRKTHHYAVYQLPTGLHVGQGLGLSCCCNGFSLAQDLMLIVALPSFLSPSKVDFRSTLFLPLAIGLIRTIQDTVTTQHRSNSIVITS